MSLVVVLVIAIFAVVAQSAWPPIEPLAKEDAGAPGILMLVRQWDPKSATLIGWLPMHRASMRVEMLDRSSPPHFELNQAVKVV